jgi:hypothetical protein
MLNLWLPFSLAPTLSPFLLLSLSLLFSLPHSLLYLLFPLSRFHSHWHPFQIFSLSSLSFSHFTPPSLPSPLSLALVLSFFSTVHSLYITLHSNSFYLYHSIPPFRSHLPWGRGESLLPAPPSLSFLCLSVSLFLALSPYSSSPHSPSSFYPFILSYSLALISQHMIISDAADSYLLSLPSHPPWRGSCYE